MLDHFGLPDQAARLNRAIETTAAGILTRDVGGTASTEDVVAVPDYRNGAVSSRSRAINCAGPAVCSATRRKVSWAGRAGQAGGR